MTTSMTRENKLSIVIAFGLLIFVGMLIADHFSIASHREVANLGSNIPSPPLLVTNRRIDIPSAPNDATNQTNPAGDVIHTVTQGETLRSICSSFYGDAGYSSTLAQWNNISNPNDIEQGDEIALPSRASLIAGSLVQIQQETIASNVSTPTTVSRFATYKVKRGDTLSEIAQKVMGTTKKTQLLIELNTDVMPDPNKIRPGMTLRYPANSQ